MKKLFIIILLGSLGCANAQTDINKISKEEKILGLSLLWKEAAYNFAYFERLPGLNWNKEYTRYIDKVISTKNDLEYYIVLQEFIGVLKEGHTRVIMPDYLMQYYYANISRGLWFTFDWVNDEMVVTGSRLAIKDSLPFGSKVIEINNMPLKEYIDTFYSPHCNTFFEHTLKNNLESMIYYEKENYPKKIKYSIPGGFVKTLVFDTCSPRKSKFTVLNNNNENNIRPALSWLDNDIAYFDMAGDMNDNLIHYFDSIWPGLKKTKGLLIDLRHSTGGSSIGELAGHFTDKDTVVNYWYSRTNNSNKRAFGAYSDSTCISFIGGPIRHTEFYDYYADKNFELDSSIFKNTIPKEDRIDKPIVILIDNNVGSATEDFLIDLKTLGLGIFVGEPTTGSCTQPLVVMLPAGGVGMIATQKTMLNRNEVFTYIKPDYPVNKTLDDIQSGRDAIYNKGLEILRQKIK